MSKAKKEHRRKVQARNDRIGQQKSKVQKMQKEFIENLIKKEREKGMFDNNPIIEPINDPNMEGPAL